MVFKIKGKKAGLPLLLGAFGATALLVAAGMYLFVGAPVAYSVVKNNQTVAFMVGVGIIVLLWKVVR